MTYKDLLARAMTTMAEDKRVVFMGYNVLFGKAAGTLDAVDETQLIEMPLAEGVMASAAIGVSLDGLIPVLYFERMDFLTNAMDAIVNHLDKIATLSRGLHRPAAIIRCVVGNKDTPLFTGPTHTQDFGNAMKHMIAFNVVRLIWPDLIGSEYRKALEAARAGTSTLLIDYKDYWNNL